MNGNKLLFYIRQLDVYKKIESFIRLKGSKTFRCEKNAWNVIVSGIGIIETLGSIISHGTSSKFADVRTHLRKVFQKILSSIWERAKTIPLDINSLLGKEVRT